MVISRLYCNSWHGVCMYIGMENSKGHIAFYKDPYDVDYEVYEDAKGELHTAPVGNCIDCNTGYRIGRWYGPKHMRTIMLEMLGIKE